MKWFLRVIFGILFISNVQAQETDTLQSMSIGQVVEEINTSNVYELSLTVGYFGIASPQLKRMKRLSELASVTELESIASGHPNAVVRLYALKALRSKANVSDTLAIQFEADQSVVNTLNGCIGGRKSVSKIASIILG